MGGVADFVSDNIGSIGGAVLGSVAGPVGLGAGALLGGSLFDDDGFVSNVTDDVFGTNIPNELKNPRLTSFMAPGLGAQFLSPELLQVQRSPQTQAALTGISDAYRSEAQNLAGLKPLVEPGFGRLTEAGVKAVQDARRRTVGDLRENLAKRRVLSSSFAADDIARTEAEFAKAENKVAAESFIKEMAMTQELIQKEAIASANQYLQTLNQLNIESQVAANISSGVSTILSSNAQLMGQMESQSGDRLFDTLGGIGGLIFG